jgi:hypothetical protein
LTLFVGGNEQHVVAARFALGLGRTFAGFEFVFAHALVLRNGIGNGFPFFARTGDDHLVIGKI